MAIKFACVCGKLIEVSGEFAGKQVRCPFCGAIVVVPEASVLGAHSEAGSGRTAPVPRTRRRLLVRRARRAPAPEGGFGGRRAREREREYEEPGQRWYGRGPRTASKAPAFAIVFAVCLVLVIAVVLFVSGGGSRAKYYSPKVAVEQFLDAMSQGRTLAAGACLDPATTDQSAQSAISLLSEKLNITTGGRGFDYTVVEPELSEGKAQVEARISFTTGEKDLKVVNPTFYCVKTRGYWYILLK